MLSPETPFHSFVCLFNDVLAPWRLGFNRRYQETLSSQRAMMLTEQHHSARCIATESYLKMTSFEPNYSMSQLLWRRGVSGVLC